MVCFKAEDGKSYNSWVDTGYRNFSHWDGLLKVDNELDGPVVKNGVVDADSYPRLSDPRDRGMNKYKPEPGALWK